MTSRTRVGTALPDPVDFARAERAEGAIINLKDGVLELITPSSASFAVALPLRADLVEGPASIYAQIEATLENGKVSFIFATADMRRAVGTSITVTPRERLPLWHIPNIHEARWLLVRNDTEYGMSAKLDINAVKLFAAEAETYPQVAEVAAGILGWVDIPGLAALAEATERPDNPLNMPEPQKIDAVPVELLGERLKFATPFDPAKASRKPLTAWKMEMDDQQIFRYLYREAKPKRHLEFGTWHGAGTVYCLEESDATVWTINLPGGERNADGSSAYNRSDTGADIGRFYLELGLGKRVCQIYSDTRDWDTQNYPDGFFDTILIDGGHQTEIVMSDTLKAIPLLRSGGLCMWHDFAPDPDVFTASPATLGVAQGVARTWAQITVAMSDIFYIWPSQILVGVRR